MTQAVKIDEIGLIQGGMAVDKGIKIEYESIFLRNKRCNKYKHILYKMKTSSPDCRKYFTHKAITGNCKCVAIQYIRTNRCISTLDAQLLQQTSYNSPQGQKHKESRYHSLFLLSVLYYQYNIILTR